MVKDFINQINSKVNRLTTASNRIDSSKVALNSKFNDLPSADTIIKQQKVEPTPTKSTVGLLGFEADSGNLVDKSIKGQVVTPAEAERLNFNEIFGKIQLNQKTDGVVQTKTLEVDGTMAKTVDQRKLAAASAESKAKIVSLFDRLRGQNGIAVQKLSTDEFQKGFSTKNNKETIQSASGIRLFVDGLNESVNEKIVGLRNKKKETKAKSANQVKETVKVADTQNLFDASRIA